MLCQGYHISGFYYNYGPKVTTFLVLLHFWIFTTFLGLTDVDWRVLSNRFNLRLKMDSICTVWEW